MLDFSEKVGLSQSAISMIENGLRHSSIQTLKKFSLVLDTDFTKLLKTAAEEATNTVSTLTENIQLKTQDFNVNIALSNFECSYTDVDIKNAIYDSVTTFLIDIFEDPFVKKKLDAHMKSTIEKVLQEKQEKLNKLYNRINN